MTELTVFLLIVAMSAIQYFMATKHTINSKELLLNSKKLSLIYLKSSLKL